METTDSMTDRRRREFSGRRVFVALAVCVGIAALVYYLIDVPNDMAANSAYRALEAGVRSNRRLSMEDVHRIVRRPPAYGGETDGNFDQEVYVFTGYHSQHVITVNYLELKNQTRIVFHVTMRTSKDFNNLVPHQ